MADDQLENMDNEGGNAPDPTPVAPPVEEGWKGPSQEEWASTQNMLRETSESLKGIQEFFNEPEPELNPDDLDLTNPQVLMGVIDHVVNSRLESVTPYVKNAAQDQGERQLNSMLDDLEGKLKADYPDGFDKELAKRTAFYNFDQTGDARASVAEAARFAAEVRKNERESSIKDYQAKNRRGGGFSDPGVDEAGLESRPKAKSYDEVIDRWAGQTEL